MRDVQGDVCGDCPATVTISRGMPGEPMTVHVAHTPGCEWFQRSATLGPSSTVCGDVATVMHTLGEGQSR